MCDSLLCSYSPLARCCVSNSARMPSNNSFNRAVPGAGPKPRWLYIDIVYWSTFDAISRLFGVMCLWMVSKLRLEEVQLQLSSEGTSRSLSVRRAKARKQEMREKRRWGEIRWVTCLLLIVRNSLLIVWGCDWSVEMRVCNFFFIYLGLTICRNTTYSNGAKWMLSWKAINCIRQFAKKIG